MRSSGTTRGPNEMLQEGDSGFATKQSKRLEVARKRQYIDGSSESAGIDDLEDDCSTIR